MLTGHTVHTRVVRRPQRADTRAATEPHQGAPPTEVETTTPYRRDFEPQTETENAGRESLPYCELLVSTTEILVPTTELVAPPTETVGTATEVTPMAAATAVLSVSSQDTTLEKPKLDTEDKTLEKPTLDTEDRTLEKPKLDTEKTIEKPRLVPRDEDETVDQPKADLDALLRELKPVVIAKGSGQVSALDVAQPLAKKPREARLERAESQGRTKAAHMSWLGIALCQPEVGASLVIGSWTRPDFHVTSPVTHLFPREDGVLVQTTSKSRYFVEPGGHAYLVRKVR